jgi:hypothetical protein
MQLSEASIIRVNWHRDGYKIIFAAICPFYLILRQAGVK